MEEKNAQNQTQKEEMLSQNQDEGKSEEKQEESKILFSFKSLEYIDWHRNWYWFLGFGIIISSLVIYAVFTKNWIAFLAFILAGIVIFIFSGRTPKEISVEIKTNGIQIGKNFFSYPALKAFWISNLPYEGKIIPTLYLEPQKKLLPVLKIALIQADSSKVEEFLKNYLKKTTPKEDFIDKITHFLKL